jgi:serine phosphatase RsbU (regulator of sigma subunit)
MATLSYLASFYLVCGIIIFFLAVTILRHSMRSIVNWSTALVLLFAGFGPLLGALGVLLEQTLKEGTYLFQGLVATFDYIWEFFFPSLVLFALVYPNRHRLWRYIRKFAFILFFPHLFHLIMLVFLLERVDPVRMFKPLSDLGDQSGFAAAFLTTFSKSFGVLMDLLFRAHSQLFSLVNIAYAVFSMVLIGRSLRGDLAPRVRRQMGVVMTGLGLCILTYSLARVFPIFAGMEFPRNVSTGFINASLILGGGAIAYSIVRHQFLDLRLIARKGILYVAAVAIVTTVYLLMIKQITGFFQQFSGLRVEILETGFIILFIVIFQPILGRLEEWSERMLVRVERSPRVRITNLSGKLLSMIELEEIKETVKKELTDIFVAERVELAMEEEMLASSDEDIYAEKVATVLAQVGEPISRLDFMEAMGFLNGNIRRRIFPRPSRKAIEEAVETLPGVVRELARFDIIVPVVRDDRCAAMLLLGRRKQVRRYSTEEQALLSMLASQIAASFSRIDMLEEVLEKRVIEEELTLARSIQLNLLPSSPPKLDGYEVSALSMASKQVGGDYYDFIHRDPHLAVAVADVSGKGVPASLLMATLQASLRSTMDHISDTVEVVSTLNDVMCETTAPDRFATLFYGCLNLHRHEFLYTNAGHFFPVVVRNGGEVEILEYSGLILGVLPDFAYEEKRLKLKPGDTLVVTTDGVTEAEGVSGELYGEERLHGLLSSLSGRSADEIKDSIVETINVFSKPGSARDDLTILVLKRTV